MKNKYESVIDSLEQRISKGYYDSSKYLPSERMLTEEFNVSRVTVRNSLEVLKHRNLIEPIAGKGYIISKNKSKRKRQKTYLIGGVFPGPKYPFTTSISSESVSAVLEKNGYHLIYSSSEELLQNELSKIKLLLKRGVDGLVIMPSYRRGVDRMTTKDELGNYEFIKKLYDGGFPVVIVDRSYAQTGIPCVCNDDVKGGFMATEYLISKGVENIIYFAPVIDRIGRCRFQGYCNAMKQYNLEVKQYTFKNLSGFIGDNRIKIGEIKELFNSLHGSIGLVTMGESPVTLDQIINIPEYKGLDIQWIGYDLSARDMPVACREFPYLKRPLGEMGTRVADKILRLINGDETAVTEEFLPPEIIEPRK